MFCGSIVVLHVVGYLAWKFERFRLERSYVKARHVQPNRLGLSKMKEKSM